MSDEKRIEIAAKLFLAWSSGDPDAPAEFLTEDAVLHDIVAGDDKVGWPAIREFFQVALTVFPGVELKPNAFWVNESGLAVRWHMSATVRSDTFGPEHKGKTWHSDGMSTLEFRGDKVCREVDYHHGGAVLRSLGITG
jgi:ketosteroid isomerase-like protein